MEANMTGRACGAWLRGEHHDRSMRNILKPDRNRFAPLAPADRESGFLGYAGCRCRIVALCEAVGHKSSTPCRNRAATHGAMIGGQKVAPDLWSVRRF